MTTVSPTKEPIETLKTIEAALKLIDPKKDDLKKAFDDLQPHASPLLSSSSLSWSQLDSHFTSLQTQLTHHFNRLQSLESSSSLRYDSLLNHPRAHSLPSPLGSTASGQTLPIDPQGLSSSSPAPPSHDRVESAVPGSELNPFDESFGEEDPSSSDPLTHTENPASRDQLKQVVARPLLVSMCERMDGKGLRDYVTKNAEERLTIRDELAVAIQVAPDPGRMVLDAMEGFYPQNGKGSYHFRKSCLDLLVALRQHRPNLSSEVKEGAKKLALEWKKKVNLKEDSPLEALGFLHLLAAYKIENEFDVSVLLDYFVISSEFRQAKALCREMGLGDKAADLIQKLIDKGKRLFAVKYIFEFGLSDKFQPVALLKDHLAETKKLADKACKDENNSIKAQNNARSREINALTSVLKVIDQYKLGSKLPRDDLEKRIEMLKKPKTDNKRPTPSPVNKPQKQQKKPPLQQNGSKRPRTNTPAGAEGASTCVNVSSLTIPPFQQSHIHPAGLLSAANPYGFVGSTPPAATYAGSSSGSYGLVGAAMGFPENPNSAGAYLYSSESQVPSSYYDRPAPVAYGSYGMPPQCHPAYYPQ